MTGREICERLMDIYDNLDEVALKCRTFEEIRDLILDLAAPETEEKPVQEPKSKEAAAVLKIARCPECGLYALPVLGSPFKWRCETHGEFFKPPKSEEPKSKFPIGHPLHMSTEEMKAADTALFTQTGGRMGKDWRNAEEKHHGVIATPGKDGEIEWCWCQKCYGAADVVHDPFHDGENWSYCKKCGVSFRLKLKSEKDL